MEFRVHRCGVTAGGHWNEQLVECLTSFKVKPEVEPYKRQFLAPVVVNAVSRYLQQGNMEMARAFLRNEYYPRRGRFPARVSRPGDLSSGSIPEIREENGHTLRSALGSVLQNLCANLPASVGAPIYRAARCVSLVGSFKTP